jgi:hypothetical protein
MKRVLLRFGWARSIGAFLTLVGVALVFVVVILPTTAFGSARSAKGGPCQFTFKSFSIDKTARENEGAGAVAIYGSKLYNVDDVQFKGVSGSKIEYLSASSWEYDNGHIIAQPDDNSLGVPGKIRLVDTDPGLCYVYSSSQYTPAHVS